MKKPLPERPVSIKDVARVLGISHSTVSRALHGSPLVSQETTSLIERKAREMGYQASAVARSLVTRKTLTIGVVVTTIADPFNGQVVSGIEEVANQHGYSVILANSQADPEREVRVVRSFRERRVDGVVVTSSRVGALYLPLMQEMKVPVVLINNQGQGAFVHSVMIDNVSAAEVATRHLIDLGHRRIAYLGDRLGFGSNAERLSGYKRALAHAGIVFDDKQVVYGEGSPEGAVEPTRLLLTLPDRPTAVFCYNDMTALGTLHVAAQHRLRVPRDLSIVGFDDLFFASYSRPELTTICQPKYEMGQRAMQLLLDLLTGQRPGKTIVVTGELIVRSSTCPPGGRP